MILIDIEVVDAPLNYNILPGRSYMYAMKKAVASLVFCTMMFPYEGKVVTIEQLTYYEPRATTNLEKVCPTIGASQQTTPSYTELGPGVYKDSTLLGAY